MAELTQPQSTLQRRTPLEIGVDKIWRFFCSVRAAIYEVSILALLVLIGTLRGSEVPQWIANAVPQLQGFVDRWYAWDVFKSFPFAFMLGLLAVAITICTINRCPGIWQSIAHPTVTTTHGFIRGAELSLSGTSPDSRQVLSATLMETLRSRRYRVLAQEVGDETHIYADRYRFGKLGTFPFHLALIMILIGGIVGARYGFRDDKFVVEEGAIQSVGHGTGLAVELVDFQDSYTEQGQAQEYRSDLILYHDGEEVRRQSITVNNPMTYRSTIFYQSSFGPAIEIVVQDPDGNMLYSGPVAMGVDFTARENPDAAAGVLDLVPVGATLTLITPDSNPFNAPELDTLGLRSGQLYVQLAPITGSNPDMNITSVINQGEPTQIGNLTITFVRESQWSLMQVANNPGIPIFWAAALLLIGGLGVVFYFPHRRIRGIVSNAAGGGSIAAFAPMAKRDWSARRSFADVAEAIVTQFGAGWRITERPEPLQSTRTQS
jgi:cytochrome c biogenesis protein